MPNALDNYITDDRVDDHCGPGRAGEIYHIAFVYDGTNGNVRFYVDGELFAEWTVDQKPLKNYDDQFRISDRNCLTLKCVFVELIKEKHLVIWSVCHKYSK